MSYHFLIINGPNINLLGIREPDIYGTENYETLIQKILSHAEEKDIHVDFYQSNHEGDLVDKIQQAYFSHTDGIVINPAAYTHTSIALLDALKAVAIPAIEVHLSDVETREDYRKISYVREACLSTISGKGIDGYLQAMDQLISYLEERNSAPCE